jgi:hypothetical protein
VNGDQIGDACQFDYDGDGQDDNEDCAPNDPTQGTPASVENVTLTGGTITSISWSAALFSDLYDVERGLITQLNGSDFGECQNARDPDRTDTLFVDDEPAPPGQGFFYLVRGVNLSCGQSGGYGDQSSGDERTNSNPSGCP